MPLARLLLLALFAYVVLDLCCPLVPGAVTFDPDESVEAVNAYRLRPAPSERMTSPRELAITRLRVANPTPLVVRVSRSPVVSMRWRLRTGHDHPQPAHPSVAIDEN